MSSELIYMQQQYAEATFDRTWQGRLFVLMRHVTGFYCIFRSFVVRSCALTNCSILLMPSLLQSPSRTSSSPPRTQPPHLILIPVRAPISSRLPSSYSCHIRRLPQKLTSYMRRGRRTSCLWAPSSSGRSGAFCTVRRAPSALRRQHGIA